MQLEVVPDRALVKSRRAKILSMQAAMLALAEAGDVVTVGDKVLIPLLSEDFPIRHHFAPHCYGREMFLKAGHSVVGKIHKHAHINTISMGRVLVFTEGEGELELAAPCTFVSSPGTKRVVHVLEDTIWTTSHVTSMAMPQLSDLPQIEREVIATDFPEDQT